MHLFELNNYIKGYEEVIIRQHKESISLAYHTAAFTNSKKVKPLKHYLDKIKSSDDIKKVNDKVDIAKSKSVLQKINFLKNKRR